MLHPNKEVVNRKKKQDYNQNCQQHAVDKQDLDISITLFGTLNMEQVQSQSHGDLHYSKKPKQDPTKHVVPQLHFILHMPKYKRKLDIDQYFLSFSQTNKSDGDFEYETSPTYLNLHFNMQIQGQRA